MVWFRRDSRCHSQGICIHKYQARGPALFQTSRQSLAKESQNFYYRTVGIGIKERQICGLTKLSLGIEANLELNEFNLYSFNWVGSINENTTSSAQHQVELSLAIT